MTSRRQVLQFGLAGAALLPVATYARASPDASDDVALYKLIVDERFPESLALARRRYGPSAPLSIIRGDVTALWYHDCTSRGRSVPSRSPGSRPSSRCSAWRCSPEMPG